jgi:hypothetical protein
MKYSKSDVRKAKDIFLRLREEEIETGKRGFETAMFSFGSGDVWFDGAVISSGVVVFELDDDPIEVDEDIDSEE